jgi:tetratricopeptide (TPR) repeat protein
VRRGQVLALFGLASALLSVALAVAVNVATGGDPPGSLAGLRDLAWPAVGVLALVTTGLAVWQQRLEEHERAAAVPAAGRAPRRSPVPAELPAAPVHFTGRAAELERVRAEIDRGATVVAIAGPAGVGKTGLALQIAYELKERYPDGQLYARLRGASPGPARPRAVLARFLTALGAPEDELRGDEETLAVWYRTRLAGRRMLLLLDDAAGADQVRPLLPGGPACLTIVTSRPVLDLSATMIDLGVMGEQDARALFAAVAGRERVVAEPEATAAVLRACGHLPLAVRIAAARLRARPSWRVATLAARLADERSRLDELRLGNTDVRTSFAATYTELPAAERQAFRRLGAHPGPDFGVGAAAALATVDAARARTLIERLVDAQLVEVALAERYRLHDLVRLFAGERLADEEPEADRAAALDRLAGWYAAVAAASPPEGWLRAERENLAAIVHRLLDRGGHAAAWRLADALRPLLEAEPGSPLAADRSFWTDLVAAARALGRPDHLATALLQLGTAVRLAGPVEDALAHLREALALARSVDDPLLDARVLRALGHALREAGQHREAVERYEQALAGYAGLDRPEEEADVLDGLGTLHLIRQESDDALRHLLRAAELRRRPDAGEGAARTQMLLGVAYRLEGRLDEARELIETSLVAFGDAGDRLGEGYALRELGYLACDEYRFADGVQLQTRAEAVFERVGNRIGRGLAQEALGDAHRGQGELTAAAHAYEQGASTFHQLGDRPREGQSLLKLAEVLARRGELSAAREHSAEAERLLGGLDLPEVEAVRGRLAELGVPASS